MDFTRSKHDSIERRGRRDLMDLEHHIHSLEIEAYISVLKAFIAQSDLLSCGKQGLISDLRKELNVTDTEHGAILIAVNSDESVKKIREQRFKVHNPEYASGSVQNSSIITKTSSPAAYFPLKNMSRCQSSLAAFPIHSSMPLKFKDDPMTAEVATFSRGNAEKSARMIKHKVRELEKITQQLEKGFDKSDFSNIKSRSKAIEMHATNRVMHNVKNVLLDVEKLDPVVVDIAKSILKEQERAILEALAELTDYRGMQHDHVAKNISRLGRNAR